MFENIEAMIDRKVDDDPTQLALDAEPFITEYKKKIGLITVALLSAIVSIGIFYVSGKKIKVPELLFVDAGGRISPMNAMTLPNQSREAVKDWAREAVQKTYTFDFLKIDQSLAAAEPYFTIDAWAVFKTSVLKSSLVADAKKNKLSVTVVALGEPIIETAATDKTGEFAWKLILPVTMSFAGDSPTANKDLIVRVTVVRVPTTENPKGLGVLQLVPTETSNARK